VSLKPTKRKATNFITL